MLNNATINKYPINQDYSADFFALWSGSFSVSGLFSSMGITAAIPDAFGEQYMRFIFKTPRADATMSVRSDDRRPLMEFKPSRAEGEII